MGGSFSMKTIPNITWATKWWVRKNHFKVHTAPRPPKERKKGKRQLLRKSAWKNGKENQTWKRATNTGEQLLLSHHLFKVADF